MRKLALLLIGALCFISLVSCNTADEGHIEDVSKQTDSDATKMNIDSESEEPSDDTSTVQTEEVSEEESSEPEEDDSTTPAETQEETTTVHTHTFGEWVTVTEATCIAQGQQERVCTDCKEKETKSIEVQGHGYGNWQTTKAATCTAQGEQIHTCMVCGRQEAQVINATGHIWSNWQVTKAATTEATGEQVRSCSACGVKETEVIPVKVLSDAEKLAMARVIAEQIAASIPPGTDLERIGQAAMIVSDYSSRAEYTTEGRDYYTAYGVFIKGEYSCAGSTRALGLVLECMGYQWEHVNENQWTHQWCRVMMDGQMGFADGQVGWVGYGKHPVED